MPLVPQVPADSGKRFSFRFSSDYNTSNARGVSVLNPILTDPQPTFPTRIMDFVSSLVPKLPFQLLFRGYHVGVDVVSSIDEKLRGHTTTFIYAVAIISVFAAFIPLYNQNAEDYKKITLGTNLHSAFYSAAFGAVAVASVAVTFSGFVDCSLDILSGIAKETGTRERFILLGCLAYPNAFAVICTQFDLMRDSAVYVFALLKLLNEILYIAPCCVLALKETNFSPFLAIWCYIMYSASFLIRINFLDDKELTIVLWNQVLFYIPFCITILASVLYWYRLYSQYRRLLLFSSSAISVGLITICIVMLAVSLQILDYSTAQYDPGDFDALHLCLQQLFKIFFTIAVTVLPGRLSQILLSKSIIQLDMKRMFVRYVSHEIRTPLNIAVVGLDVLIRTRKAREERTDPVADLEEEELMEQIKDSCRVAVTILDDLLAYEKLDSGILALEKSEVNVVKWIKATAGLFNIQVKGKDQLFTVLGNMDCIDSALTYDMDEGKMAQVLRNFISNAIKFTPEGGAIRLDAFIRIDKGPMLVIHVIDSGAGLAPDQICKIFKEIIQFNANKLQGGGGSGLGLWVSNKIVGLHEGQAKVTSEGLGRGCVFEIALPLATPSHGNFRGRIGIHVDNNSSSNQSAAREMDLVEISATNHKSNTMVSASRSTSSNGLVSDARHSSRHNVIQLPSIAEAPVEKSLASPSSLVGLNCLVVDDSKLNRKIMARLLRTCGIRAEFEAGDGVICVDMVHKSMLASRSEGGTISQQELLPFDVIFMDNNMPNMTGTEATRALRLLGYNGIIVGVTGDAQVQDIKNFIDAGADDVFVKPINVEAVENRLRGIMCSKRENPVLSSESESEAWHSAP